MKDRTFNYAKIVKLIDLYQKNDCLWNISTPDFRRQDKRHTVLSKIAKMFDITPVEVKRKIRSLRATYLLERRKVIASEKKVRDGLEKHLYEPVLAWYKYMSFLDDIIVFRTPTASEKVTALGEKLDSRTQTKKVEDRQVTHLEKVEEIYYDDDCNSVKPEEVTMSAEYLEAKYLYEDTVDQIESIEVPYDAPDFLVGDYQHSSSKTDEGNLERDNEELDVLKSDRIRAETEYFRKKAEYIDICIEKERKIQPLMIAKLKLEIENLTKRSAAINSGGGNNDYNL